MEILHWFNHNEGTGLSHTFCGAVQTPAAYQRLVVLEDPKTCDTCDVAANEQAAYEYANDI